MVVIPVERDDALDRAARRLAGGGLVAIPTDTVYGLAADAGRPEAVERIFEAKGRPGTLALPVLVAGADQARALVMVDARADALIRRFWPGALTLVLPARAGSPRVTLGGDRVTATIGVRCPDHPVPLALCRRVGPLATTSANSHGEPTPATAEEVAAALGHRVDLVLDGGPSRGSAASTVVAVDETGIRLLRAGAVEWPAVQHAVSGMRS